MIKRLLNQFLVSCFDNPKSKIQNRKLVGIVALVVTFVTCGVVATAQQPKKVHQIGYLSATDAASDFARSEAIRLALRAFGYVEGQNIATHYRYAEGKQDRLPELAAELVRLKVDIIVVAAADRAIRAAKNATKTIAIVMVALGSTLSRRATLKVLPVQAATSLGLQILLRNWVGSGWSS
jgi:ABC-type uncharacterized transport system substrate-binding protein